MPTIISRASTEVSSPMPIFQLNPRGRMTGSINWPSLPMTLSASCGKVPAMHRQMAQDPERNRHADNNRARLVEEDARPVVEPQPKRTSASASGIAAVPG